MLKYTLRIQKDMDWQRTLLISGMAITAWLLLIQWNDFIDQRDKIVDDSNEKPTEQIDYFSDSNVIELEEEVLSEDLPIVNQNRKTALSTVGSYKIEDNSKYGLIIVKSGDIETILGFPTKDFFNKLKNE